MFGASVVIDSVRKLGKVVGASALIALVVITMFGFFAWKMIDVMRDAMRDANTLTDKRMASIEKAIDKQTEAMEKQTEVLAGIRYYSKKEVEQHGKPAKK